MRRLLLMIFAVFMLTSTFVYAEVPTMLPHKEITIDFRSTIKDAKAGNPWKLVMESSDVSEGIFVANKIGYPMGKDYKVNFYGPENARFIIGDTIYKITVVEAYPPSTYSESDPPETPLVYHYKCWLEPTQETECEYELYSEPIVKPEKKANPFKVSSKGIKVKAKTLKKKSKSYSVFSVKNAKGTVRFQKVSKNKKIVISKKGKVTLKKGLKKGKYTVKVKVTASGNKEYKVGTKITKLTVRVK